MFVNKNMWAQIVVTDKSWSAHILTSKHHIHAPLMVTMPCAYLCFGCCLRRQDAFFVGAADSGLHIIWSKRLESMDVAAVDRTAISLRVDAVMTNATCLLLSRHAQQVTGEVLQELKRHSKRSRTHIHMMPCMLVCVGSVWLHMLLLDVRQWEAKNHLLKIRLTEQPWLYQR